MRDYLDPSRQFYNSIIAFAGSTEHEAQRCPRGELEAIEPNYSQGLLSMVRNIQVD